MSGVQAALPDSASDQFRKRVMRRIQQREIWHDRYLSLGWPGVFDEDWKSLFTGGEASSDAEASARLLKVGRSVL